MRDWQGNSTLYATVSATGVDRLTQKIVVQSEQRHPQEHKDRAILDRLSEEGKSNYNLVELARLRIRYQNFPGARALQQDLDRLLTIWELSEEELFAQTQQLHAQRLYRRNRDGDAEDWS